MDSHSFLQDLPKPGSQLGSLLHCRQILYHLSHQGSPWTSNDDLHRPGVCMGLSEICRHMDSASRSWNPISNSFPKRIPLRTDLPVHAGHCRLVTQSCLTHCNAMDCSPPGSSVHEISQTKLLEWVAMSFSRGSSQPRDQTHVTCIGRWILYYWTTREAYPCRLSTPNPPVKTIPFLLDQIKAHSALT